MTVAKKGPGMTTRPISSSTTTRSTIFNPAPPYFLGEDQAGPPEVGHLLPLLRGVAGVVVHHLTDVGHRAFGLEKLASALAQHLLLFTESEIHSYLLCGPGVLSGCDVSSM